MKNKAGRLTLPDFETYCKATVSKTVWYSLKDRHTDQCRSTRTQSSEINPHNIYDQLTFDKGVKTIQWGKEQSFQQMG